MQINTNYLDIANKVATNLTVGGCELGLQLSIEFDKAKQHRITAGVDRRLKDAFYSSIGEYSPDQQCSITANGEDSSIHTNIFANIRSVFLAWHFDRVDGAGVNLFTVDPTPLPDVPEDLAALKIEEALQKTMSSGAPPEKFVEVATKQVKDVKRSLYSVLWREAKKAADGAKNVIMDMMEESNFLEQYRDWWFDFATYPYAVLQFPYIETKQVLEWKKDKLRPVSKQILGTKRISPMDFWCSADSTNGVDGKAAFVRSTISYDALLDLKELASGRIDQNLDMIINKGLYVASNTSMMSDSSIPSLNEKAQDKLADGTYELVKCWIKLTGAMLKSYGVRHIYSPTKKDVEDLKRYEIEAWIVNSKIVYIAPNYHPTGKRPFYTASYEPVNGSIYGRGLYDKVSPFERNANQSFRLALINKRNSSGYIAEVDASRFAVGYEPTPAAIQPNTVFHVANGYDAGGSQSALKFHQIPSVMATLYQDWERMKNEAETVSGIYAFMGGATTQVSSSLRTKGAIGAVQGNSTKRINFVEQNADMGALQDMFRDWWTWCMVFHDDATIKVDASISIRGLVGVMAEQENKQQAGALMAQYMPTMISVANQTQGTPLEKFAMGAMYDAAEMLGGRVQHLQDPDELEALQNIVGQNPTGQMPVQEDVSGMTMDGRSAVPPSADELNRLPAG